MSQGTRDELLGHLAGAVGAVTATHPTRVAIDGPPAAGKTTLADELAVIVRAQGRAVIRATIDDFLFPRAQRYPRGEFSAEGCYFDTHDYDALNRVLLDPLGPDGDRRFRHAVYDHTADTALSPPVTTAPADAVLLFDGVFLMRPELIGRWDLRIFVSVPLDRTVDRAVIRERRVSSPADVERRWRERYIPSQQLYFATARPTAHADIIVHNDDPQQPAWAVRDARSRRLTGAPGMQRRPSDQRRTGE
ncbi:MAG: uridylate kinase [Actinoplanes sp.]